MTMTMKIVFIVEKLLIADGLTRAASKTTHSKYNIILGIIVVNNN